MDKDKIQELLETRALADQELEKMRVSVTILFSDIKGSTTYFERNGDVEGLAMVERHHSLMRPIIEHCGGRLVKTIGDAIMASFVDPVNAIKAAIGMQRSLDSDRTGRPEEEQIHIRVGLHTGLGLVKDKDIYGDVVNAASRVQHQAKPGQILITDVLLEACREAGAQCVHLGRADLKGKDEPLNVYAVAWSAMSTEQLIDELRSQFDNKLKEVRRQYDRAESEFESSRSQWRVERRALHEEVEKLEIALDQSVQAAREQITSDLQSEIQCQLDEAVRARCQLEDEYGAMQLIWEEERQSLRGQISAVQGSMIDAMERNNNSTRIGLIVREQVEARLDQAKRDWQIESDGERRRMQAEIDRLKKAVSGDAKKDAARTAVLQKLGKLQPNSGLPAAARNVEEWEREFENARIGWETERDQLNLKIEVLERKVKSGKDEVRGEIFQELHAQYEPQLAQANRDRLRVEQEMASRMREFEVERQLLLQRANAMEQAIPDARDAARRQTIAEMKAEYEARIEELKRVKARVDRRFQDQVDEAESERRRLLRQIVHLEGELKEARETAYRARISAQPQPDA
jgi:class 3 adenylate cyclase